MNDELRARAFGSRLAKQAMIASDVVQAVFDHVGECWEALTMEEIFNTREIILTGCGDSYCAAVATQPLFEKMTRVKVRAMPCIEVSRCMAKSRLGYRPDTPLVIGISVTGTVSRVEEAIKRAAINGANTLAVTDDPDSPVARSAAHTVCLGLPKGLEYSPGANSYNGSLVALMALAMRMGRVKNNISEEELFAMRDAIPAYAAACQARMEEYREKAFQVALRWKDLRAVDFIGDYGDYATAFFGSAKVLETYGGYTTYDDSEDWCHINYFIQDPRTVGRVVIANQLSPSFGRIRETIRAICLLESPCMVVTDADPALFPPECSVFTFPKPDYFWLAPLMQHFAFDMVAGGIEMLLEIPQFRSDLADFHQENTEDEVRIRSSKIEMV